MNLREALRTQSPSYALQEAARDEIARLDAALKEIASGHLPAGYPMTDAGLLQYHADLVRRVTPQ